MSPSADPRNEAIARVFQDEGHSVSNAAATVAAVKRGRGSVRTERDLAELMHETTLAAWTDGIELGLALAARDMVPARRLLDWIRDDIYERDPDCLESTEASIAAFLEVLER